jgi:hypothetical protein
LKYWKKGISAQFENFQMARELAALNWNENVGKSKNLRTADFRKGIIDNFHEMLLFKK